MSVAEKTVKDIFERVRAKYKDLARTQVMTALAKFKELNVAPEQYVSEFGEYKELFALTGTIPVDYKGRCYNIPIQIYLPEDFPYKSPICFVRPTPTMSINVTDTVDSSGRITIPYLTSWGKKCDLKTLLELICVRFGSVTPLYLKSANRPPTATNATQYPTSLPPVPQPTSSIPTYPYQQQQNTNANSGLPYPSNNPSTYPSAAASSMTPYPNQMPTNQPTPYPPYGNSNPYMPAGFVPMPQPGAYNSGMKPPVPPPPPSYPGVTTQPVRQPPQPSSYNSNYSDETLKPEYMKMSMVSAVGDKARQRYYEYKEQFDAEIQSLRRTLNDLQHGEGQINEIILDAEIEIENIKRYTAEIKQKTNQINENLNKMKHREKADIEDAVVAPAPLYRQIMQLFAEELAIQDLIYYLNEGLSHKTVSLESYLKQTRVLSRKLFLVRALILKCRETAGLRS